MEIRESVREGTDLELVRLHGADLLHEFGTNFKSDQNYEFALIARNVDYPEGSRDLCIADMSHEQIIETVEKLKN